MSNRFSFSANHVDVRGWTVGAADRDRDRRIGGRELRDTPERESFACVT